MRVNGRALLMATSCWGWGHCGRMCFNSYRRYTCESKQDESILVRGSGGTQLDVWALWTLGRYGGDALWTYGRLVGRAMDAMDVSHCSANAPLILGLLPNAVLEKAEFFKKCTFEKIPKPFAWCSMLRYNGYPVWLGLDSWHVNVSVWHMFFMISDGHPL